SRRHPPDRFPHNSGGGHDYPGHRWSHKRPGPCHARRKSRSDRSLALRMNAPVAGTQSQFAQQPSRIDSRPCPTISSPSQLRPPTPALSMVPTQTNSSISAYQGQKAHIPRLSTSTEASGGPSTTWITLATFAVLSPPTAWLRPTWNIAASAIKVEGGPKLLPIFAAPTSSCDKTPGSTALTCRSSSSLDT